MNILVLDNYHADSMAWLKTQRSLTTLSTTAPETDVEGLLIRSSTQVDQKLLNRFPNLKAVVTATIGFDHIDWLACEKRGVKVAFCPNANVDSAAEHTLFLILSLLKHATQANSSIRGGHWRAAVPRGSLLRDKTVGLIGLGRIGSRVAELCKAFGARIVAHDPYQLDSVFNTLNVTRMGFVEVLREADLLSFHVPHTKITHHMINRSTLMELSTQAYIVNASRGSVIEESDLITALRENKIAGAALDVFAKEPMEATSFLLREKKMIATPHIGAHTEEAWMQSSMEACKKMALFSQGQPLSDTLPLNAPWFADSLS